MSFYQDSGKNPSIIRRANCTYTSILQTKDYTCLGSPEGDVEVVNDISEGRIQVFDNTFDPLENENIDRHINAMAYLEHGGVSGTLFACNDRHIKAINIRNDTSTQNICDGKYSSSIRFTTQKLCQNVHTYALNSMSISTSGEYLITSDYIKINLWNPQTLNNFYNIIDIKSQLSSGLVFVINTSKFSPFEDNIFGYSTSNGKLILNDTNISPKSEPIHNILLQNIEGIRSISDFTFFDENLIATRTINNVSMFDLRNTKDPIINRNLVVDPLELNMLNSESVIYDKFGITNCNGKIFTGSYFGSIYSIDGLTGEIEEIENREDAEDDSEGKVRLIVSKGNELVYVLGENKLLKYSVN